MSLKTRSLAAMAACRMLYFSLRSCIGRKNRCAYWINATSTPIETAPRSTPRPPIQITMRDRDRAENLDYRIVQRVGQDRILEGDQVRAVDGFEVLVGALLPVEELYQAHAGNVFLRVAVDPRNCGANAPVANPAHTSGRCAWR